MTEEEWLSCTDSQPMLLYLNGRWNTPELRAVWLNRRWSDRKQTLFACQCCRRVWYVLNEPQRTAIEAMERSLDGLLSDSDLSLATKDVDFDIHNPAERVVGWALSIISSFEGWNPSENAADDVVVAIAAEIAAESEARIAAERAKQAELLREMVGNPFRPPHIAPEWLLWNSGIVKHLAQTICDELAFDNMPILGDALEDAGCTDRDILDHCRSDGPHVRGCWVIDLILSKDR